MEACPGAGKSVMAAEFARHLIESGQCDFVLAAVPWKSIQGDENSGMIRAFDQRGMDVRERLFVRSARLVEQPLPKHDAVVTTYSEVMTQETVETMTRWHGRGKRFAVILDEIHHANELRGKWGTYADQLQKLAEMTIVMSGTYFRTDRLPIKFVQYDANGRPILDCEPYQYPQAVRDGVCRPVSCRFVDAKVRYTDTADGEESYLSAMSASDPRLPKVMRDVLEPDGPCVREIIRQLNEFMNGTQKKFSDAGALITCRPGKSSGQEDKHVHKIAAAVQRYTGYRPVVVTHDDPEAPGKIDSFRRGSERYLVAVNMVSEGVDIPRLRAVAMLRHVTSELQFRQITGRCLRMTSHEDGTAACVFMPDFVTMHQFGLNLEGESQQGMIDRRCRDCGQYPCECDCHRCGHSPCVCSDGGVRESLPGDEFEVLETVPVAAGGAVSGDHVGEHWIAVAEKIREQHAQHSHANPVQLAHAIQAANAMGPAAIAEEHSEQTIVQRRSRAKERAKFLLNKAAKCFYNGDFASAWYALMIKPHGIDWTTAQEVWSVDEIEKWSKKIEAMLTTRERP
jgi:superfamily II DNA or RNA helicase